MYRKNLISVFVALWSVSQNTVTFSSLREITIGKVVLTAYVHKGFFDNLMLKLLKLQKDYINRITYDKII